MSNELTAEVKEMIREYHILQGMVFAFNKYCKVRSSDEIFKYSAISGELIQDQKNFREFLLELTKIPKGKRMIKV